MHLPNLRTATLGAFLAVSLAACGAGAGSSGVASLQTPGTDGAAPTAAPTASLDPDTARLEFARCMREHGVDMPDPQVSADGGVAIQIGGDGVDPTKVQEAQQACDHFLQAAFGSPKPLDPEQLDRMVKFAGCMREHGVDFPDPSSDGTMTFQAGPGTGMDPNSSAFQDAQTACQPLLGTDGPMFGAPGGPSTDKSGGSGGSTTDGGPGVQIKPVAP